MEFASRETAPFATSRLKAILAVVVVFLFTSTLSLVLRFIGKRIKKAGIEIEDWIIVAAQVAVCWLGIACVLEVALGNAGHHGFEAPSKVPTALKLYVVIQALYALSVGLIKVSICLFYNRLLPSRMFRIASWTVIACASTWTIGAILYTFLACRPLHRFSTPTAADNLCVRSQMTPNIIMGALDIAVIVAIFVLPLPMLRTLQLRLSEGLALSGIFVTALCTIAVSILRIKSLTTISSADLIHTVPTTLIWTFLEPALGVSVTCAPFFRPFMHRAGPRLNSDIELQPYPARKFRPIYEDHWTLLQTDPTRRVGKAVGLQGAYIFTQVVESGHWSTASQFDSSKTCVDGWQ